MTWVWRFYNKLTKILALLEKHHALAENHPILKLIQDMLVNLSLNPTVSKKFIPTQVLLERSCPLRVFIRKLIILRRMIENIGHGSGRIKRWSRTTPTGHLQGYIWAFLDRFQSNQMESSQDPKCNVLFIHQRHTENQDPAPTSSDLTGNEFSNRQTQNLPYLELSTFGTSQSYVWHPRDSLLYPKDFEKLFKYTNMQGFKQTSLHFNFPKLEPFELNAINAQHILPLWWCTS